jgi:hypothetical protein
MKIFKIAWSDKKANEYVNYYVFEPDVPNGNPVIMKAPLAMSSRVAKEQYNKQRLKGGGKTYDGSVMYVRLDLASGRLYLPEIKKLGDMSQNMALMMLDAVKVAATKEFGDLAGSPPIAGDPSKVLRVRSINDFAASAKFIRAHLKEESLMDNFVNLPVVEANLSMMPDTLSGLPGHHDDVKSQGGYIGPEDAKAVVFMINEKTGGSVRSRQIHIQATPFILVNTSPEAKIGESDKERIVITGYKDLSTRGVKSSLVSPVGKYTVKYLLYMGYSFKDLCRTFLAASQIKDFGDLMQRGAYLLSAARDLKKSGYTDPASEKIYYCFKIDSSFPFKFKLGMVGSRYPEAGQSELFTIVHYDAQKSFLIFKTPLLLSDDVCTKILNAKDFVTRCSYDPSDKKIKTDEPPAQLQLQSKYTLSMITDDLRASGVILESENPKMEERHRIEARFAKRKVSDYYQAHDLIKNLIKKLSTDNKKVEFNDMPVIVGPWEQLMNIQGGYTSMRKIKEHKYPLPLQPIPGVDWYVMPPFIMIDDSTNPSVADQTHIIIHEYRHHINEQLGVESPTYDVLSKSKDMEDAIRKRLVYLNSPDERESHIEQMEYLLGIGWTKDDIVRHFMGGEQVTMANMRVARKYLELVNEAARRASAAEEESIGEEVLDRMLESMDNEEINLPE